MKRLFCLLLCTVLLFSLAACNNYPSAKNNNGTTHGNETEQVNKTEKNNETESPISNSSKPLIVYFSMPDNKDNSSVVINGETLGNTQYMAYVIEEAAGGDIFRIEPEVPYTTDHDELVDAAEKEKQENARPKIKDSIENFDDYDTFFVGYPNWWADMPMILYTFFDTYDFSGKTIITFNTHGGSGFSGTNQTIAELEPDADVITGLSISRNDIEDAKEDIINWLNDLGFNKEAEQTGVSSAYINLSAPTPGTEQTIYLWEKGKCRLLVLTPRTQTIMIHPISVLIWNAVP